MGFLTCRGPEAKHPFNQRGARTRVHDDARKRIASQLLTAIVCGTPVTTIALNAEKESPGALQLSRSPASANPHVSTWNRQSTGWGIPSNLEETDSISSEGLPETTPGLSTDRPCIRSDLGGAHGK